MYKNFIHRLFSTLYVHNTVDINTKVIHQNHSLSTILNILIHCIHRLFFYKIKKQKSTIKWTFNSENEVWVGIEPTHKGFADPRLTTWLPNLNFTYSISIIL